MGLPLFRWLLSKSAHRRRHFFLALVGQLFDVVLRAGRAGTVSEITTAEDRCRGVLLGLAAGDRNGGPIRMAVRLGESLLEVGQVDPQDIMGRYLRWWREGAFDTGPVSGRALELLAAGMSASEASAQVHREFAGRTAGCNPAHRSSPLAMLASLADDDLPGCAITEARLTHHDPLAGEVAAAATPPLSGPLSHHPHNSQNQRPESAPFVPSLIGPRIDFKDEPPDADLDSRPGSSRAAASDLELEQARR